MPSNASSDEGGNAPKIPPAPTQDEDIAEARSESTASEEIRLPTQMELVADVLAQDPVMNLGGHLIESPMDDDTFAELMRRVHDIGVDPMDLVAEANPYSIQICLDGAILPDEIRGLIEHLNHSIAKQVADAHPNLIGRGNPEGSAPSEAEWQEHARLSDHRFKSHLDQTDCDRVRVLCEGWGDKALLD